MKKTKVREAAKIKMKRIRMMNKETKRIRKQKNLNQRAKANQREKNKKMQRLLHKSQNVKTNDLYRWTVYTQIS